MKSYEEEFKTLNHSLAILKRERRKKNTKNIKIINRLSMIVLKVKMKICIFSFIIRDFHFEIKINSFTHPKVSKIQKIIISKMLNQ